MPSDIINEIKKLLAGKTFGIFYAAGAKEESLLAMAALAFSLQNAGKIIITDPSPETFATHWKTILPTLKELPPQRPLRITIPKNGGSAEISYDENKDSFFLTVAPRNYHLTPEDIQVDALPPQFDAIFCFAENEDLLKNIAARYTLPPHNRIIIISASEPASAGGRLIAEKTADIIRASGGDLLKNPLTATLLFASLVAETDNFQKNLSKSTMALASELLEAGADKDKIRAARETSTVPHGQILGRALARTYADPETRSAWTFLMPQDFQKTGAEPSVNLFTTLATSMRKVSATQPLHLFLWKEANGLVHSLAFAEEQKTLKNIAIKLAIEPQENYLKLPSFQNFTTAEKTLKELLKNN
jgi:hypothetical protein